MKQTAVEWLIEQYMKDGLFKEGVYEQAKEMEKQQIADAYKIGRYENDKIVMSERYYAEQYYNETFNK
jgi:hypothetical protein